MKWGMWLLLLIAAPLRAETITLVADVWPPYNNEADAEKPGYGVEMMKTIFGAAGHQIDYRVIPWNRAIKMVQEGKADAVIGATTEEVPEFIFPERAFGISKIGFYVPEKSEWRYQDIGSLNGMRIGAIKGFEYGEELDGYFIQHSDRVQFVYDDNATATNLKKLLRGRIDTFVEDVNVVEAVATQMGISNQIKWAGDADKGLPVYIAFSPQNPKSARYAALFSEGLAHLRSTGELANILQKYGLQDWWVSIATSQ